MKKYVNISDMFCDIDADKMKTDYEAIRAVKDRISRSKKEVKPSTCVLCGKTIDGTCNSHSIPKFCLEQIAINGEVNTSFCLGDFPAVKSKKGINQAGTFHLICRSCDNLFFTNYENPENYYSPPVNRMLAEIVLKSCLMLIYKRRTEIATYASLCNDEPLVAPIIANRKRVNSLDLNEFEESFYTAKKAVEKGKDTYRLVYHRVLDYTVPLAFQGPLGLAYDFEDRLINDLLYYSPKYKIEFIHICIMPMKEKSIILMFIEEGKRRYSKFIKQFNKLSADDQLLALLYIIITYSEDYFLSPCIYETVVGSDAFRNTLRSNADVFFLNQVNNKISDLKEMYDLSKRDSIPNILLNDYRVRNS